MDRREALAALAGSGILIKTEAPDDDAKIKGVGVLRYPSPRYVEKGSTLPRDIARMIADFIKPGAVIGLPNDRDEHGAYCWDFRIEGGDMSQVKIERNENGAPGFLWGQKDNLSARLPITSERTDGENPED